MKGTKRTILALMTGFAVGKTVDSIMDNVDNAGPVFAVGRIIADVSFGLVGMGCALRAFDAIGEAGKAVMEGLAKYGREHEEDEVTVEDVNPDDFESDEDEEDE